MNKVLIICFSLAVLLLGASHAHATVGGPTYVYDLKYNSADTSVYYTEISESGRGCPPILRKVSVATHTTKTVLSCDDTQELPIESVEAEIEGTTAGFKNLTPISLTNNNVRITLIQTGVDTFDGVKDFSRTFFTANIHQDDNFIGSIDIQGCDADQEFLFAGYAIPTLTKKVAIILSTKGDCFEGGYTYESLYIIDDVTVVDRTTVGSQKTSSALRPSGATTIGQLPSSPMPEPTVTLITPTETPVATTSDNSSNITIALIAAAFLVIGVILGYHTKK